MDHTRNEEPTASLQKGTVMRTVQAPPRASLLIESMRDIGYSLETALADIVDNSITAGASTIRLFVDTDAVRIGLLDDGVGMTESGLLEAMRPGSRSPLEERSASDLGRFGLGLKTASFSQCRKLTVVTRRDGHASAAQWDLDYVAATDGWFVSIPDDPLSVPWASLLGESGTLIVWDNLDRVLSANGSGDSTRDFIRRVDDARAHLELVFHRYLAGERGLRRIRMFLNQRPLEPFDPFHSNHPATVHGPPDVMQVNGEQVTIQAFTLPHHRKVTTAEWERYGGTAGYLKNQGFYVYREKRLIIHGTWFGLARQTELTKLARVRVDIPNRLDSEWKVDVKKASVQPPYQVRERLRRIIETLGATSKRIYRVRGQKLVEDNRLPVWNRVQDKNEIMYRVNSEHPVLADFLSRVPEHLRYDFSRVIEFVGSSLPMDALFADMGGNPDRVSGSFSSDETLHHAVAATYRQLTAANVPTPEMKAMMQAAEPFRSNWARTEAILEDVAKEKN